jgi:succinyl-CoA synthetase alpha subunit
MGQASAMIAGGRGTAKEKMDALRRAGGSLLISINYFLCLSFCQFVLFKSLD